MSGKNEAEESVQKKLQSILSGKLGKAAAGISIYHGQWQQVLYEQNEHIPMVPASATKLLTTYTVLKYLPDRLPGWYIYEAPDTIYIKPNADGTFLHRAFKKQQLYDKLLATEKKIVLNIPSVPDFVPWGYRWPDNSFRYLCERSLMPVCGNTVRFYKEGDKLCADPPYFQRYLPEDLRVETGIHYQVRRKSPGNNGFEVSPSRNGRFAGKQPFTCAEDPYIAYHILQDVLGKHITISTESSEIPYQPFYTYKTDEVLRPMMHHSDNFLAEQLLLMVNNEIRKNNTGNPRAIHQLVKDNFPAFENELTWVDGSGLSRDNQMSPRFFIELLTKMKDEFSEGRLKKILPRGGEGTLQKYYHGYEKYIYAKTGGLKPDIVSLNGFLDTKKGHSVIFSFVINNHRGSRHGAQQAIEQVLTYIINHY